MSTAGLTMMVLVWLVVGSTVTYFFLRVLRTPPKDETGGEARQ